MKSLLIFVTVIVTASCQIHTKLHADGYHYDRPQNRLNLPEDEPKCPNNEKLPYCCENGAENAECSIPTPPPPPVFIPKINLPSVIPVKPTSAPVPKIVTTKRPPLPFPPVVNLPSIIPKKQTQASKAPVIVPKDVPKPIVVAKPAPFIPQKPSLPVQPRITNNDYLPPEDEWVEWKRKYNKRYATQDEDDERKTIFYENVRKINLHNAEFQSGRVTFELEKNKFCDLTQDEFKKIHTGIRGKNKKKVIQQSGYKYPKPNEGDEFISLENYARFEPEGFKPPTAKSQISSSSSLPQSPRAFKTSSSSADLSDDFKESLFKSSLTSSSIKFDSSINKTLPSNFKFPFLPPSFLQPGLLPVSPSSFKSPSSSSSLPVSPTSFSSNRQGQENMTNVFMASSLLDGDTEDEVDWRKKGAITPVKNQGKCASCWAFSANGALEAHNFLRKKTGPIPLSEQNLIDCVRENDGCDGGYMTNAYEYVERNRGVDTEASYPYEARDNQKCRFQRANVGGESITYMEIQEGNEEALRQAVATVGPVAAGIDGAQHSFQFYKAGYYFEPKCEQDVNHALLIVGYGKTEKGEEYWIGKNSWDTDWGEAGYIRMAKNRGNHCGITNLASYPIV